MHELWFGESTAISYKMDHLSRFKILSTFNLVMIFLYSVTPHCCNLKCVLNDDWINIVKRKPTFYWQSQCFGYIGNFEEAVACDCHMIVGYCM